MVRALGAAPRRPKQDARQIGLVTSLTGVSRAVVVHRTGRKFPVELTVTLVAINGRHSFNALRTT